MDKCEEIANEIRKLGDGYCQILCDSWVRYLGAKNAAVTVPDVPPVAAAGANGA